MGKRRSRRQRRSFTREERRRYVEAWRRSGLSQLEFGRRHDLHGSLLTRWKQEFPEASTEDALPALVPVRVVEEPEEVEDRAVQGMRIRFPSGIELSWRGSGDEDELLAVLRFVAGLRC